MSSASEGGSGQRFPTTATGELPHALRFALRLPADPTRLSLLRQRLEEFLVAHEVGETDRFDLSVAVSEAAANAIEHPLDPAEPMIDIEVTLAAGAALATVRDSGRWRETTDTGLRGRGLALIAALGELNISRGPAGTVVRLRRQLRAEPVVPSAGLPAPCRRPADE